MNITKEEYAALVRQRAQKSPLGRDMAWMVKVLAESRVPVPESTPRPMMNFIR